MIEVTNLNIYWIMIIGAIIIGIAITFLFIQCLEWGREGRPYSLCILFFFLLIALETLCINEIVSRQRPKAMDVYQGKTTIEYTIRDGVKVDSIVVFKENYD